MPDSSPVRVRSFLPRYPQLLPPMAKVLNTSTKEVQLKFHFSFNRLNMPQNCTKKPTNTWKSILSLTKKMFVSIRFCQLPDIFLRAIKDIFPLQNPFVYMTSFRRNTSRIVKNCLFSAVFLLGLLVTNTVTAQDGKTLFNTNCCLLYTSDAADE